MNITAAQSIPSRSAKGPPKWKTERSVALALRLDCPIFVEADVLKHSRMASAVNEKSSSEELRKWLENLNDEDLGGYKM
jgi:hypothetical protein